MNVSSRLTLCLLLAGPLLPGPWPGARPLAAVQAPKSERAEGPVLTGAVVDARTGSPMPGAIVVLEPDLAGVFPSGATGSSFAVMARTTLTDSAGRYRFGDLSPGSYRLYATHYGYRPYAVVLELGGRGADVSVGLEADPIPLEPLHGRAYARGPFVAADPFRADADMARVMVAELRRRRFLSTDVRELTEADVVEGVSLGEPDLFRALQRLPGVTTRSDYTAALWTRGAPWSQTRVYYDGVPLFNPLHALGMVSGISSSAVGTVWFHPGVRSAGIAEGAAGVIDLRSRPAAGTGELNMQADASLATAGLALDQRVLDGRAGWMLSGRRSYLDWLADLASHAGGRDHAFPYHFTETSGRLDARLGDAHTVEASWLWEGDELTSAGAPEGAPTVEPIRATWGNRLGRLTWTTTGPLYHAQHTLGASRHVGLVRTYPDGSRPSSEEGMRRGETGIGYLGLRGAVWPAGGGAAGPRWTLGYELTHQDVRYMGPVPLSIPAAEADAVLPEETTTTPGDGRRSTSWQADLGMAAVWGEALWQASDAVSVRGGVRVETGGGIRDAPAARVAPRLTARLTPIPEVAVSAAVGRVYQYTHAVAPGGVHVASLVSTDAWLLAGPGVPVIRSDLLTAGVETWLAPDRIATLNVFGRLTDGVVVPNPEPGSILNRAPALVTGTARAAGVEASVRQLAGPVTGSASYSLTRSRVRTEGREFPSSADRTHVLNATAMVRPLPRLRLGAAVTAATGVPFTRAVSDSVECGAEPGCDPAELPWAGEPNATRAPAYASVDLLLDWSAELRGFDLGFYAQLRNVLGRDNATVYAGDGSGCLVIGCSTEELRNAYERGVPRLPVIGVRVRR